MKKIRKTTFYSTVFWYLLDIFAVCRFLINIDYFSLDLYGLKIYRKHISGTVSVISSDHLDGNARFTTVPSKQSMRVVMVLLPEDREV